MLNGVGGRTVDEAKERMSFAESLKWREYLDRRGTANLGIRLEAGFALIALSINRALGGHARLDDYAPHLQDPESSIEDVMKILTGSKK